MRWLLFPVALLAAVTAFLLPAQTAAPNASGVSFGHIHLYVPDTAVTQKLLVDLLGGTPQQIGALNTVKTPGVYFILTQRAASADSGSKGSAVDHIGFSVKSFAETKAKAQAAGLAVQELVANSQAFVTLPGDVILEIFEEANIAGPAIFTHYHLNSPDPNSTREWYIKTFGGVEGERRKGNKGAVIPGGIVDILAYGGRGGKAPAAPLAPTKGRALDHIGFEVKDLKAFAAKLEAEGIKLDVPYREAKAKIGVDLAFITDPNGAYIELTEGLAGH